MAKLYCKNCGDVNKPKVKSKGSALVAIFLLLFGLLPGIIYIIWDATTKDKYCRKCDASGSMVPLDSPIAKQALEAREAS